MVNRKRKGDGGERDVAAMLTGYTGVKWRRTQQHSAGGKVGDVEPDEPHRVWSRLHIEVKNNEQMKIGTKLLRDAMRQAERDAPKGSVYLVVYKERRGVWVLVVPHTMPDAIERSEDSGIETLSIPSVLAHYAGDDIEAAVRQIGAQIERRIS